MNIQPKPYMNNIRLRRKPIGPERKLDTIMTITDKSTILPRTVTYEDIDAAVFEWVDKTLYLSYEGKQIPTFKLFSNQRINEYAQTWQHLDDEKNILMNFKTLTRDNNPQSGENQGKYGNIPGNRKYSLFKVPVLEENGEEVFEIYTIRQPIAVNFSYIVVLICDKYKLLNDLNTQIQDQFKSLECYIFPNGHAMPMVLDTIEDESEYTLNDRKYYSQAYKIKLMGYVITENDYDVIKVPSRFKVELVNNPKKMYKKHKGNDAKFNEIQDVIDNEFDKTKDYSFSGADISTDVKADVECSNDFDVNIQKEKPQPTIDVIEGDKPCMPDEESPYEYKSITFDIRFPVCDDNKVTFICDINFVLNQIELVNIFDFKVLVNGEKIDFDTEDDIEIPMGSEVSVFSTKDDQLKDSQILLYGYDKDFIYDKRYDPESSLDEIERHKDIIIEDGDQE